MDFVTKDRSHTSARDLREDKTPNLVEEGRKAEWYRDQSRIARLCRLIVAFVARGGVTHQILAILTLDQDQ